MDRLTPELERIFAAKAARRRRLAAMPIAAKVRAIVVMQQMVAPLLRARGKRTVVWKLD